MPIGFSVSRARHRVDAFTSGPIGLEDVSRFLEQVSEAGAYGFDHIVDLRAAEFLSDAATVRRAVLDERERLRLGPNPHTALVTTPGTPTHETVSALAASFSADGMQVAVFSTLVQAEAWLERVEDTDSEWKRGK